MDIPKRLHFVGIGGIGMSGIARVLHDQGYVISGSDQQLSHITDDLQRLGATIKQGHHPDNVGDAQILVISSAVPSDNPEVMEAQRRGLRIVKRAEALGWLFNERKGIAIAGTHGKTTTTAMVALILREAGLDPFVLVGGEVPEMDSNAVSGSGAYIVAEADEYDGSFLKLAPYIAAVTNIDDDHLDYYKTLDNIIGAFGSFLAAVPEGGYIVFCGDDPVLSNLVFEMKYRDTRNVISYGYSAGLDCRAVDLTLGHTGGYDFEVLRGEQSLGRFSTTVPGTHNVLNALAALAVGNICDVPMEVSKSVLKRFEGVKRRFETKGVVGGVTIVDDYAHHPAEVEATLKAARTRYGDRRIVCLFQPHTYSRTKLLGSGYAEVFSCANEVLVTDIYAAREENTWGASVDELCGHIRHEKVTAIGSVQAAEKYLGEHLTDGDVLITMGAGNVYQVGEALLDYLARSVAAGT
ncbi:MAG: UDP-N-acetylmuramate--L-alanine ligase [Dehalococcoidia bacterium]|nr:UDP-N-acetylmuramate--L-alanine ligase [Dehalococcoidia bacterium]